MATPKSVIRQTDLAKILKAHRDAGIPVARTEIDAKSGKVIVFSTGAPGDEANDWDNA